VVLASYLYAIRGLPVGLAYSIVTSSVVVGTLLAGYVLFDEHLSAATVVGVVLVGVGVTIIATQQLGT
jgi:multidrug transporter EmrE-like cation transporter